MPASDVVGEMQVERLSLNDADSDEAVALFDQGNEQLMTGNFLGAVASYDKALEIQHDFYYAWCNRGVALGKLEQYEQAITSYDKALEFKSDLHQAWCNRGNALYNLGQYEQAIASYDKALSLKHDDHQAWNSRGNALDNLGQYEQAIASYDKALEIKPDYHDAWCKRGMVLENLGRHEEAIASFDKALQIQPDLYETWHNRGVVLKNLGRYEQAIASFDKVLSIKPDDHEAWNNRGAVLCDHLQRYEEAIAFFDKALEIKSDYYEAWGNRGVAAGNSRGYSPQAAFMLQMQFPKSQVVKENPTLTERGYEGRLLCLQEGLKHCPQDTHPEGWGCLHQAMGYAHYVQGQEKPIYNICGYETVSVDEYRKAVNEYQQALLTLTPEAFPELHLEVVQKLINVLFGLRKDAEAKQWRKQALEVLQQQFNTKTTSAQKHQLVAKYSGLSRMRVDILVEDGDLIPALETAERYKNLYLTGILDAQNQHILSPSYQEIQQLLNSTTAIIYWHLSECALTTFIIKHGAEEPIVIKPLPNPPLRGEGVRAETDSNTSTTALKCLQNLEEWVKDWDQQYQDYSSNKKVDFAQPSLKTENNQPQNSWRDNLPGMLENLSNILNIPGILYELANINQLILIPHRDLHRFPIHALFPNSFTITYLPSAQIGLNLQTANIKSLSSLLSVEHPNSENLTALPYAEIESAAITQLFNNCKTTRISGQNATKEAVIDALKDSHQIFHFTGHGAYTSERSKKPALFLSGTDDLTIEDIHKLSLNNYQLITLAACETGITDRETIKDEYVGLVSSFMYQQAANIVTTLWTIPEEASSLLMIYFYWQIKKGKSPNIALFKAVNWLKNLTDKKLERYYEVIFKKLPQTEQPLRPFIRRKLTEIKKKALSEQQQKKFNHPYYWAAFTITGNINPKLS
ncbi:MAG: CHAT domain-containing tetratricopeptide repeat protein [Coleofasciculaceae cyanobacterium]